MSVGNPGQNYRFQNMSEGQGCEIITSDGTRIRFNLVVGQSVEVVGGAAPFTLNRHDMFNHLIGTSSASSAAA